MSYLGTIVIECEVEVDTPAEAFDELNEICDEVHGALGLAGIDYLQAEVGSMVHECDS